MERNFSGVLPSGASSVAGKTVSAAKKTRAAVSDQGKELLKKFIESGQALVAAWDSSGFSNVIDLGEIGMPLSLDDFIYGLSDLADKSGVFADGKGVTSSKHRRAASASEILDYLKKNAAAVVKTFMSDDLELVLDRESEPAFAAAIEKVPGSWRLYGDRDSGQQLIAVSMKKKGIPSYDDVVSAAASALNLDPGDISSVFTPTFFNDVWSQEVSDYVSNFTSTLGKLTVSGRSGGWWGFPFDSDFFSIDVDPFAQDFASFLDSASEETISSIVGVSSSVEDGASAVIEFFLGQDGDEYLFMKPDISEQFKAAAEAFDKVASDFAGTQKWVDKIRENEWYSGGAGESEGSDVPLDLND